MSWVVCSCSFMFILSSQVVSLEMNYGNRCLRNCLTLEAGLRSDSLKSAISNA